MSDQPPTGPGPGDKPQTTSTRPRGTKASAATPTLAVADRLGSSGGKGADSTTRKPGAARNPGTGRQRASRRPSGTRTAGQPPAGPSPRAAAQPSAGLPDPSNQDALEKAKADLEVAEQAEENERENVVTCRAALKAAKQALKEAETKYSPTKTQLQNAQVKVNRELDAMANECLDIVGPSDTVVQGQATFTAKPKCRLKAGLVSPDWVTGGCPIVGKSDPPYEITIDTSSVEPGAYDIRVFLTLKRA